MAAVTGNNLTIFAGDDMNVIGCEESCSINVTAKEIITTTKGSGKGTNRVEGNYDCIISATGVMFIHASEATAAAANKQDPTYFHSYIIQGKKVCAKYQITDGSTTKYVIGNFMVRSATYSGGAGDYATYDIELALDGELYESAAMQSGAAYDGPSMYVYDSTGTTDGFTSVTLEDASRIYFIVFVPASNPNARIVYQTSDIQTLALATDLPVGAGTVGYHAASGTINFEAGLLTGDKVLTSFDVAD
jgi:hypothetical protein